MPNLKKENIIDWMAEIDKNPNDFPVFIETGTFLGETTQMAASIFKKVYTIEVDERLYNNALFTLSQLDIGVINGDSLNVFPELLPKISDSIVFWLDGHYSGQGTGYGKYDFPALQECELIDNHLQSKEAFIMIDDVRLFGQGHAEQIDDSLVTITIDKILSSFSKRKVIRYCLKPSELADVDRLLIHIA
jgi:hypothetical protein